MVRILGDPLPLKAAHVPEDSPELGGDQNIRRTTFMIQVCFLQVHHGNIFLAVLLYRFTVIVYMLV